MSRLAKSLAHHYGGGGGFVPTDLGADLLAWYTTPFGSHSDGDTPTVWPDSSGNANDQSLSGTNTYKTAIRNGHDVLRTAPTLGGMANAINSSAGLSIYFVGAAAFGGVRMGLISDQAGSMTYLWESGTTLGLDDAAAAHSAYFSSTSTITNWHIAACHFDTTSMKVSVDGVDGTPTVTALTWSASARYDIGPPSSGGTSYWGDIGEVVVCNILSGGDDTSMIGYLKSRWNIA